MRKYIAIMIAVLNIIIFSVTAFAYTLYFYTPNLNLYNTIGNIDTSSFNAESKLFYEDWLKNRNLSDRYFAYFNSSLSLAVDNLSGKNEYNYSICFCKLDDNAQFGYIDTSNMPSTGNAYPNSFNTINGGFKYITVLYKCVDKPLLLDKINSFTIVGTTVKTYNSGQSVSCSQFLKGLFKYNDFSFIPINKQTTMINSTITNLIIDNKITSGSYSSSSSSSSTSNSIPFVPITFPTIEKSSNPDVHYDITIWNDFLTVIKKYINVALGVGLKIFIFILSILFISTLLKVIRDSLYRGGFK